MQTLRRFQIVVALVAFGAFFWLPIMTDAEPSATALENYTPSTQELAAVAQRGQRPGGLGRVYKDRITPHWFAKDARLWYRNDLPGGKKEFIAVDAEKGVRQVAFDHAKLAVSLSKAAGKEFSAERLPFDDIEFVNDGKAVQFKAADATWQCDLSSFECTKQTKSTQQSSTSPDRKAGGAAIPPPLRSGLVDSDLAPEASEFQQPPRRQFPTEGRTNERSPNGKWTAFIKDNNVVIKNNDDSKETQVSQDGKAGLAYGMLNWSPDSKSVVAFRIEPGDNKEVYLIESSPVGGGRAKMQSRPYPLPGDKFTSYEMHLYDAATAKEIKTDIERVDFGRPRLRWNRDGHHFSYEKTDRGHQRFRVIEIDAHTGQARNVIDDKTETFVWTAHGPTNIVRYLDKTDELIYESERDGWRHLYLIDAKTGSVKNPITKGDWVMRGIDRVDEENRQIWFRGSGKNAGQDPYLIHHYRVNFDGSNLTALTESDGNYTVQFSPERKFIVATYSRVDQPPTHELRRVSDGKLVCELEKSDIGELKANGWTAPEVFVAKARDGKTDIWGIITRPKNFDPNKKYPVLEYIYAGPQGSFVPKTFSAQRRFSTLTDLGFFVVQMDGMGTANRSKAFHDVCWHNLADAGFPDRILWHQAVAKKYPQYNVSRVGIYGTSAGGQNATGAVLFHPEFYKAAVSACGCHDNRMDKASWNEQWMGYPVGPHYAACSNIDNAHRLRGHLMLIVGEMDTNVPPESTFRLASALIKANKEFDLIVVPGVGHSDGGPYGQHRMRDFFVRHLHGITPPAWNGGSNAATGTEN